MDFKSGCWKYGLVSTSQEELLHRLWSRANICIVHISLPNAETFLWWPGLALAYFRNRNGIDMGNKIISKAFLPWLVHSSPHCGWTLGTSHQMEWKAWEWLFFYFNTFLSVNRSISQSLPIFIYFYICLCAHHFLQTTFINKFQMNNDLW